MDGEIVAVVAYKLLMPGGTTVVRLKVTTMVKHPKERACSMRGCRRALV